MFVSFFHEKCESKNKKLQFKNFPLKIQATFPKKMRQFLEFQFHKPAFLMKNFNLTFHNIKFYEGEEASEHNRNIKKKEYERMPLKNSI